MLPRKKLDNCDGVSQREVPPSAVLNEGSMPVLCCPSNHCLLRPYRRVLLDSSGSPYTREFELHRLSLNCFLCTNTLTDQNVITSSTSPIGVLSEMPLRAIAISSHVGVPSSLHRKVVLSLRITDDVVVVNI